MTWIACIMFFLLVIFYVKFILSEDKSGTAQSRLETKIWINSSFSLRVLSVLTPYMQPFAFLALFQLKTKWTKVQKTDDSDEDFTPGSSRKTWAHTHTHWLAFMAWDKKKITLREKQFNRYCTNLKNPKVFAWFDLFLATALNQFMQINNSPPLHRF